MLNLLQNKNRRIYLFHYYSKNYDYFYSFNFHRTVVLGPSQSTPG